MLTQKIERHSEPNRFAVTSAPPMIGPTVAATPMTGPKMPIAAPALSAGKTERMIARPCGSIRAAARPCRNRAVTSICGSVEALASADIRVKAAMPPRNIRRRPKRSPSRPPVIRATAMARV